MDICSCMGKLLSQMIIKILLILNDDTSHVNQIKSEDIVKQLKILISVLELILKELQGGKHDD